MRDFDRHAPMIAPVITTNGMNTNQNLFITASVTGTEFLGGSLPRPERAAYDGRHRCAENGRMK